MTREAIATGVVSGLLVLVIGGLFSRVVLPRVSSRVARLRDEQRAAAGATADRYQNGWALTADVTWGGVLVGFMMLQAIVVLSITAVALLVVLAADAGLVTPWLVALLGAAAVSVALLGMTVAAVFFPVVRGMRERDRRRKAGEAPVGEPPPFEPIDFNSS